jgi:acyl carrier protein
MTNVSESVLDAIRNAAGSGERPLAADLLLDEDLGIDSLDFVQLVQAVEERLDIVVSDEAAAGVKTVGELVALADAAVRATGKSPPDAP